MLMARVATRAINISFLSVFKDGKIELLGPMCSWCQAPEEQANKHEE
jgi:hypothetical protein